MRLLSSKSNADKYFRVSTYLS